MQLGTPNSLESTCSASTPFLDSNVTNDALTTNSRKCRKRYLSSQWEQLPCPTGRRSRSRSRAPLVPRSSRSSRTSRSTCGDIRVEKPFRALFASKVFALAVSRELRDSSFELFWRGTVPSILKTECSPVRSVRSRLFLSTVFDSINASADSDWRRLTPEATHSRQTLSVADVTGAELAEQLFVNSRPWNGEGNGQGDFFEEESSPTCSACHFRFNTFSHLLVHLQVSSRRDLRLSEHGE